MAQEIEEIIGLGRLLSATMEEKSNHAQDIHSQMFAVLKRMITQQETQVRSTVRSVLSKQDMALICGLPDRTMDFEYEERDFQCG